MTHDQITGEVVITATEFKAKCLELLDRVQSGAVTKVTVTKRGKRTAVVRRADQDVDDPTALFGSMKGTVIAPDGFDFTAPMDLEPLDAERGILD